ncbi:MAG: prepilin-type N-terminal cleavage/methylation domain-containing protein [Bryobacteraceae bacterium]
MPISSVGSNRGRRARPSRSGVTLVEMLVVVMILSVLAGISYPSMSAAIDSLRINNAASDVAAQFNLGLNRAERGQTAVEIAILPAENAVVLASPPKPPRPPFFRRLVLPVGVSILTVLPAAPGDPRMARGFLLYPGGSAPRVGVLLGNSRGDRRLVRVDPVTGVPLVERLEQAGSPGLRRSQNRGFTLLEVLVGTTIMAVAIAALMSALGTVGRRRASPIPTAPRSWRNGRSTRCCSKTCRRVRRQKGALVRRPDVQGGWRARLEPFERIRICRRRWRESTAWWWKSGG